MQQQIPVIHPVIDYDYTFDHPVIGGELGFNFNFTSLTRQQAEFDAINQTAANAGTCSAAYPAVKSRPLPVARHSRHLQPFHRAGHRRRSFTDSFGQVFTPFMSVRADAASMQINDDPSVSNYINTGDTNLVAHAAFAWNTAIRS